jgi:2-oxoglutarate ferredoxin oxidoreductase subunit delta
VPEADKDKCTGCASCAQICPDVAIKVYRTPKKKEGK